MCQSLYSGQGRGERGWGRGALIAVVSEVLDGKFVALLVKQNMVQFIFVLLLVGVMVVSYAGGVYFVKILRTNTL